jgi:hypothetical protein
VLFTPKMSEIPSYGNYSRSPFDDGAKRLPFALEGDLVEMTLDLQMRRAVPGYAVLGWR